MKAYIITCNGHISSCGFQHFADAEEWMLTRNDNPKQWQGWVYIAAKNTYKIHEVFINEE